jgi:SAM-dependent methyltransferase
MSTEHPIDDDNGWSHSADAYIAFQDAGDPNRTLLLDPIMLRLCGDVAGKRALDVGCGEGRFCRMLRERDAETVGVDPIERMTAVAHERASPGERYVRAMAEHLPFADASFEVVVSYITLVDITGYRDAIAGMARVLRPGGRLVVANLGFVTASGAWEKAEDGTRLHYKVDRYAAEHSAVYEWLGIRIRNWHRPLSAYMDAYLSAGLTLREFLEPVPEDESLREHYWAEDWFRIPYFTVMLWEK